MTPARDPRDLLQRYEAIRPWFEPLVWIAAVLLHAAFNSTTAWLDLQRSGRAAAWWEPVTWEFSSNLVTLALLPALIAFERRAPLRLGMSARDVLAHAVASVVFSVVHVVAMVSVRKLVYTLQGGSYDFGDWPRGLFYEYLKDVRTYAGLLATVVLYRLVLWRMRGEAALLAAPDEGPAVEPVERPERFLVKKLGKEFLLPAHDIEWLQAWGNYVNLRVRGRDHPLRSTISGIEARLDPVRFTRVHRSYIVNIAQVEAIEPQDGGDASLLMKDGSRVPCSRRYRDGLREKLTSPSA